jgi:hypothetical protein
VQLLALLHEPGHGPGGVEDRLAGGGDAQEAAQLVGPPGLGGRPEDPRLELVVEDVAANLERGHLGRQGGVLEQQRRVGQAHRDLGGVLHLDEDVDGPIELGEHGVLDLWPRRQRGRAGEPADQVDALLGPLEHEDVAGGHHVVGPGVEHPFRAPPHRDDPHPGLHREGELAQRASDRRRILAHLDPAHDLVGVPEVRPELVGDAQVHLHHPGDVGGRVADLLDGPGDVEHAGHGLRVLG